YARHRAKDQIPAAVGKREFAATFQGDPRLDELKLRFCRGRVQRYCPGVVHRAAQRQQGAVADGQRAGIVHDRRLIKYEVARSKRHPWYAIQRDRLPVCQRDYRISIGIGGQMAFHVIEAGESSITDELNPILARIEAIDDVMADWLREDEQ